VVVRLHHCRLVHRLSADEERLERGYRVVFTLVCAAFLT
jgi:hypothetical protein